MAELLETARDFGMQVQPQLVLLQKTLLYVEGLGRQLYPQLDLWETAEPFMRRWAVKHLGPVAVIGKLLDNGPKLLAELHRLPELLDDKQTIELRKQLAIQRNSIERLHDQVQDQHRRSKRLGWFAGFLLSALAIAWWLG
jgi:ubiquinone biosynthesis protein